MDVSNLFAFLGLFQHGSKKQLTATPHEIEAEGKWMLKNGLTDAILGFNPGSGTGEELSQLDTLFKNNRWYLASNMRQLLSQIYVEHGLIQTVVDVPVDDGMRGGGVFKSGQLSPDNLLALQAYFEQENILSASIGQALKWTRLFGGGGVLVITGQPAETPLDISTLEQGGPIEFRPVDMWELYADIQGQGDTRRSPDRFSVEDPTLDYYSYYGKKVHKSRVLVFRGMTPPSMIRPRLRGWGFSVVENLVRSINQYLKSNNLAFEVLDEFKVDVFRMKGLSMSMVDATGFANVKNRIALANAEKNYKNAITLDAEDEYMQKQLSFSGLAEVMKEIRMQVASDVRMPLSKLFGISATGFNSGEDDIENYNGMVESQVRQKSKHHIVKLAQIACQTLFGIVPDDLMFEFKPLRIMSSEQEENVKTQKFNRLLAAWQAGGMTTEEFKQAINADNLLPVRLDSTIEKLDLGGGDDQESGDAGEVQETSTPNTTTTIKDTPLAKNSYDIGPLVRQYMTLSIDERNDLKGRSDVMLTNPAAYDETLWNRGKAASLEAFGDIRWEFVMYWYENHASK